jgi:DNA invertase Pin-like site-specific DNA recombinase
MKIVAYHRVSTVRQGQSGLGLEAQDRAITDYASARGAKVVGTYTEVESGKNSARPELAKALHQAQVTGATLVIAKLDRLSRNAAFLLTLRDSGTPFIAVDMPDANELTVGIMAVVAEAESKAISRRTKDALAAAKARGTKLGNPNGAAALRRAGKGNAASVTAIKVAASAHAAKLKPIIEALRAEGVTSLGGIATALNQRGILTPRGGDWHRSSVANLLARCGAP